MCASPVAAVHVEQNDDEAQAVTGQVGATKESGESPCTMLPSRHLTNDKETESRGHEMMVFPLNILSRSYGNSLKNTDWIALTKSSLYTDGLKNTTNWLVT